MKSKINFKKLLSLLLLSANFTFLPTIINSQSFNNLVYAEPNFDSNQGIEVTTDYYNTPLIHILDTQFYVEKKLFDNEPERYSKDNLNKIYNEAKEKASNKIGLTFSDNIKISIYIYDDNNEVLGEYLNSIFFDFSKKIEIKKSYFFNSEDPSFSGEIMKALLFFNPDKNNEIIIDYHNTPLIHIPDTQFYVEKKLFDNEPERYSKDNLNKRFNEAKEKASNKTGLTFNDNIKIPIYIYDDNNIQALGEHTNADFTPINEFGEIRIKNTRFFNPKYNSLPHEMIDALLFYSLGEHYNNLNRGIDEGFATQVNDLDNWGELNELPDKNLLFVNSYLPSCEDRCKFYHSHQHLIHDLINLKGKNLINDFIELVKNGMDSVEALRFLGADEIIEQYNTELSAQEYYWQINFGNQLSYA